MPDRDPATATNTYQTNRTRRSDDQITSPQNPRLKARAPPADASASARAAAGSWPRARICSPPPSGPGGAPSRAIAWPARSSAGDGFHDVEAQALAAVSTLGSGTRVIGVYEQRWAQRRGPAVRVPARRRRPGQRRHGAALGARVRRLAAWRSARAAPTRTRRRRCARAWARSSPSRSRASATSASCRASGSRWSPMRRTSCAAPGSAGPRRSRRCRRRRGRRSLTLLVGAEREGLPAELVAACERTRAHPDRRASRSTPRWPRRWRCTR